MIETIFYFAQNPAEYESNKSQLSERTIAFVPNADGTNTGKIYKYGVQYGGSNYSLPKASASTLGGIMTNYTTSGSNYGVRVDNNGNAYVNVPSTGGGTSGGGTHDYTEELNEINSRIDGALEQIANIVSNNRTQIEGIIDDSLTKYKGFLELVKNGTIQWNEVFNYGNGWDAAMKQYLYGVGLLTDAGTSAATAKWAELKIQLDSIESQVGQINIGVVDENGNPVSYETLKSAVINAIKEDPDTGNQAAIAELTTSWAYVNEELLEYAFSGFKSLAENGKSIAQQFADVNGNIAAVQTSADNNSAALSAIAARTTTVEGKVQTLESAGFISEAQAKSAVATMFANNENDIRASITTQVKDDLSSVFIEADQLNAAVKEAIVDGDIYANSDLSVGGDIILPVSSNVHNARASMISWSNSFYSNTKSGSNTRAVHPVSPSTRDAYITFNGSQWVFSPELPTTSTTGYSGPIHALGADFTVTNGVITSITSVDNLTLSLT